MPKWPNNRGKNWSQEEIDQLKKLVRENTPTRVIGLKLGRSSDAIYSKAFQENISLKPNNQSPYNKK